MQQQGAGGECELDPTRLELAKNPYVDRVLVVHVRVVVGREHVVHDLEVQRVVAILLEMRSIEPEPFSRLDDGPDILGDPFELSKWRRVLDAKAE